MRSFQATGSPHALDIASNSSASSSIPSLPTSLQPQPSLQTLVNRQALFDSSTKGWVQVPRDLILLPSVEGTNANTTTGNMFLGVGTDDERSVQQGHDGTKLQTEEHPFVSMNGDGNTANTQTSGHIRYYETSKLQSNITKSSWLSASKRHGKYSTESRAVWARHSDTTIRGMRLFGISSTNSYRTGISTSVY